MWTRREEADIDKIKNLIGFRLCTLYETPTLSDHVMRPAE